MSQQDRARDTGRTAKGYKTAGTWGNLHSRWHGLRTQQAWTRSLGVLMALMLVTTAVPVVPASDAPRTPEDKPAGCEGDPQELGVHPTEELHWNWGEVMELKHWALRFIYSAEELDDLDEMLAQDDAMFDPLGTVPAAPWEDDPDEDLQAGSDLLVGKEELARSADTVEILKERIQVVQGSAPILHTRVYMVEQSGHMDLWSFLITVKGVNGTCYTGSAYDKHAQDDKYGKRDRWVGFLELPLAEISDDLGDLTGIEVTLNAQVCRYGWFSGKKKGECVNPTETDELEVEVVDNDV